jgi:hypothetical protein
MRRVVAVTFALLLLAASAAEAIFMQVFLDTVPVARLIANLTQQVGAKPNDPQAHWALGRAHAMAASDPARSVEVARKTGHLWFGYTPKAAPYPAVSSLTAAAREHLDLAISHHQKALALGPPMSNAIRLGLAWCLQQAGRRAEAVTAYRQVIADAWEKERGLTAGPIGGNTLVAEAAHYLMPLLDPVQDRAEITELKARAAKLESLPVPITPVLVDLTGRGDVSALVDRGARVAFDLEGRGAGGTWQWVTPSAAWLVWDPYASGRITSGTQLFGAVTFLMFWQTGYDALATLDDDGDGWLRGAELRGLAWWRDADGDGHSDRGEVTPVTAAGVVSIATRGTRSNAAGVIAEMRTGVTMADGRSLPTFDVLLAPAPRTAEGVPSGPTQ